METTELQEFEYRLSNVLILCKIARLLRAGYERYKVVPLEQLRGMSRFLRDEGKYYYELQEIVETWIKRRGEEADCPIHDHQLKVE